LQDPISKIATGKWNGGVVHMVYHVTLPCKHKALSSNPNPIKKKKKKQANKANNSYFLSHPATLSEEEIESNFHRD
jgi:hypothetical protein